MKPVLKVGAQKYTPKSYYCLEQLEHGDDLHALIKEAEATLNPCALCGEEQPIIMYHYYPDEPNPHYFFVICLGNENTNGCGMQTYGWCAKDDDDYTDIRYALNVVCDMWNRRPNNAKNS